jgi:hypothetical protein
MTPSAFRSRTLALLFCTVAFALCTHAQSKQVRIVVTTVSGQVVTQAQVSVTALGVSVGLPFPGVETGNGEYVVTLPQVVAQGIVTIKIVAPGFAPYQGMRSLAGYSRVTVVLSLPTGLPGGTGIAYPGPLPGSALATRKVKIVVNGQKEIARTYPLFDATVTVTVPSSQEFPPRVTPHAYTAAHIGQGIFELAIPVTENGFSCSLTIQAPQHETASWQTTVGLLSDMRKVLKFNDYTASMGVDSRRLVEIFGDANLQQDGPPGATGAVNSRGRYLLPFERNLLYSDGRFPGWHWISNYPYREKLYHDLLKELILQTSQMESFYAHDDIAAFSREAQRTLGSQPLRLIGEKVASALGTGIGDRFTTLSASLENVGVALKVQEAGVQGLFEGVLLAAAYQEFQDRSYDLLLERSQVSQLFTDPAYKSAVTRLRTTLDTERSKNWRDLVRGLQSQKIGGVLSATVVKKVFATVLSKAFGLLYVGSTVATAGISWVVVQAITDMLQGTAKQADIESSLLLLAAIENSVLGTYIDGVQYPVPQYDVRVTQDEYYGGLMRLHAGFLVNSLRTQFYSGAGQGIAVGLVAQLHNSPTTRKIIDAGNQKVVKATTDYRVLSACFRPSGGSSTMSGVVADAVTNHKIAGATVRLEGPSSVSTTTQNDGTFAFPSILPGRYRLIVTYENYADDAQEISIEVGQNEYHSALSPVERGVQFRIVLSWGSMPPDLDSHLFKGPSHVWYRQKGSQSSPPYTTLDVDVTTGYGPETVTIDRQSGDDCRYFIHRYSSSGDLSRSGAVVKVYSGSRLLKTFSVPTYTSGRWWHVFDISVAGALTERNQMQDSQP